jgi:heme exporter protein C
VLFFIYIGYIALWEAIDDQQKAGRAAAIIAIVGFINVPIVKYSVDWWNTLHQPASITRLGAPAIHWTLLVPLLVMAVGYTLFFCALLIVRVRTEILKRRVRSLQLSRAGV